MNRTLNFVVGGAAALLSAVVGSFVGLAAPDSCQCGDPDRITDLKAQITTIALTNQLNQANLPAVRAQIQPLVDELVASVPSRTEAEKSAQVIGGWQNLWSDMSFGPMIDYQNVYQVVYAGGFYYNISKLLLPTGDQTAYLRGSFADAGDHYDIQFTKNFSVPGWLQPGSQLIDAGMAAEQGQVTGTDLPGPIGVRGNLQNTYVDDDFRIVTGKSDGDAQDFLFVLKRFDAIQ